jgi:hypothetical protein
MQVDTARIKQQYRKDYQKALRALAAAREELDHFKNIDVPGFARWLHGNFGQLLTQLRELTTRLAERETFLMRLNFEMLLGTESPGQIFRRVKRQWNEPQEAPPPEEEFTAEEDPFQKPPGGGRRRFEQGRRRIQVQEHKPLSRRLKEIYRALVRRLHPDTMKKPSKQKLEWWHQAQEAYERGDADQLEMIWTLCEVEEEGIQYNATMSVLQRVIAQLKNSVRQIKKELSACRRDPAWKFTQRPDLKEMASSMKRQLTQDAQMLRDQLQNVEADIAAWEAASKQRPRTRRRSHWHLDEW